MRPEESEDLMRLVHLLDDANADIRDLEIGYETEGGVPNLLAQMSGGEKPRRPVFRFEVTLRGEGSPV